MRGLRGRSLSLVMRAMLWPLPLPLPLLLGLPLAGPGGDADLALGIARMPGGSLGWAKPLGSLESLSSLGEEVASNVHVVLRDTLIP